VSKEYWLVAVEEDGDDITVHSGPYKTWDEMKNSPDFEDLYAGTQEDLYRGYCFLIVEPKMVPVIGGFRFGTQDPTA